MIGLQVIHPAPAPGPLDNPLKGWCTYVDAGPITQPYSMVFLYVPWNELEPEKGRYAFNAWEKRAWNVPAARGRHVVFRVYVDYPGRPSGLPDWLRREGVKTTHYTVESGGESPNYDAPRMRSAMGRLVEALGKRYDKNPRVAFVEFGLLGFWGEWHTYPRTELFAKDETANGVLAEAHLAFPNKRLMTRYPSGYAGQQRWLGFFDDYFPEDTDGNENWQFLPRLRQSGRTEAWKTVPFGGEMVPRDGKKWVGEGFAKTLKQIESGHFSWIGPYSPAIAGITDPNLVANSAALVRRMGYEYRLDDIRLPKLVTRGTTLKVEIKGTNQGVAPFYYRWPVELALMDPRGVLALRWTVNTDVRNWLPGSFRFSSVAQIDAKPGQYKLVLGIRDPWTMKPAIGFANSLLRRDGWTELAQVRIR